jgi:transcription elongation factor Elf1
MEEGRDPVAQKARMKPLDWQVDCPACGNFIVVVACENNDGSFHADNGDQFLVCDECGTLIEVLPAQVVEFGR